MHAKLVSRCVFKGEGHDEQIDPGQMAPQATNYETMDRKVMEKSVNPINKPTPRPGILDIAPYVPGRSGKDADKDGYAGPIYKLSSNESALGASPFAIAAYGENAGNLHLYPDGGATQLRTAISKHENIDPNRIICGAGSDEILQLLCRAYLGEGDNIVQSEHGFLVYSLAAQACGAVTHFAPETNLTANVDTLLEFVDERTRLVFIANPNNPTGTYLPASEIERLHAGLRSDIILVIDAAYAEYMEEDDYDCGAELVERFDNVIMTRTFSKIYGLGALRLGWAYGAPEIIDALHRIRGPFNVSSAAQIAGIAAIEDQDFVRRNLVHNRTQRDIMVQRVRGLGLEVHPSFGNFILVKFPMEEGFSASQMETWLASKGVMVREMKAYRLPDYLRISIGSEEANTCLMDLLEKKFAKA